MCDGANHTNQHDEGKMMTAQAACIRPLTHLTAEQLVHEQITTHQRVHAQLDALDAVYGPGATATLRAALNAQWEADGEDAQRVGDARARAEGAVDLLAAELAHAATVVAAAVGEVATAIEGGLARYPKGKVPQWAKDASVAATKAQGVTSQLAGAAQRARAVNQRINR